jgi:hypothetical protein
MEYADCTAGWFGMPYPQVSVRRVHSNMLSGKCMARCNLLAAIAKRAQALQGSARAHVHRITSGTGYAVRFREAVALAPDLVADDGLHDWPVALQQFSVR